MKKERNAKIATNVSLLVRLHKIEMKEELIKDCLAYVSASILNHISLIL